jgi:CubicO group peptidase (beta-lactamase class C family)
MEVALALLFFLAIVGAGSVALYVVATKAPPLYTDPDAVPSSAAAAPTERYSSTVEEARQRARALMVQEEQLPSLSVAVAKDGEIVWAEGFGYRDAKRLKQVTPRTRFRAGSVSKTLTAAAVALLYDRKRVDLDAPVQTYVPAYPKKQWTVTTRQLLGDVAGVHRLRGERGNNDQVPRGHCRSVDDALKTFAYEPLAFEPGTQYRYSTSGWILLSAVVEGVAGEPFSTFMSREVFTPLRMDRTALEGTPLRRSGRQTGTDDDPDTAEFDESRAEERENDERNPPVMDYSCTVGGGAFLSTPSDLVRLGSAMLNPGLLKAETIALFQTPLRLTSGTSTGFALGWKVDSIALAGAQVRVIRHRASLIAGAVSLYLFPDRGLVIAVTSNVPNTVAVEAFALQVAEAFTKPAKMP